MYSLEDIEEHYLTLVKFHALKLVPDEGWRFRSAATSDRDLEHLEKYVQKIKDTKFRQRLVVAFDEFFAHRRGNQRRGGDEEDFKGTGSNPRSSPPAAKGEISVRDIRDNVVKIIDGKTIIELDLAAARKR
jgi:hypothetical protein